MPTDGLLFNLQVGNITGTYATLSLSNFVISDADGNDITSFTMGENSFGERCLMSLLLPQV